MNVALELFPVDGKAVGKLGTELISRKANERTNEGIARGIAASADSEERA